MLIEEPPEGLRANPGLKMVHQVEAILRQAYRDRERPLSYKEIERRLPAKRTDFYAIQAAVLDLARRRWVVVGSDGIQWIVPDEPRGESVPLR